MRPHTVLYVWLQSAMIAYTSCQSFPIVNTPSGPIKGIIVPTLGKDIVQFRNIPYAKPPVGNLRFEKTLPVEPWTETLDGTVFGPSCMQDTTAFPDLWKYAENTDISEDCLQLNVYVPGAVSTDVKKSVMVWIHGGAFTIGNSWGYDGSFFAMKDVIFVSINYRLGLFGFLNTEDATLPSNFGFWDMIEALKWVNKNIASFGGDPESVTIFGESAGGFSVSSLAVIPSTAGLFKRIIPQSGPANGFMGIESNPARPAKAAGKLLGCITDENRNLVECLKKKTSEELLKAQLDPGTVKSSNFSLSPVIWPSVDGELLRRTPLDSLLDTKSEESIYFRSLDMLVGATSNEGNGISFFLSEFQKEMEFNITEGIPTSVLCEIVAPTVAKDVFNDGKLVSDLICKEYSSENLEEQARKIANLCEDVWFIAPTVQLLDFHAKGKASPNTYQYSFAQKLKFDFIIPDMPWTEGAGHGSELLYMFGPKGFNEFDESLTSEEGRTFTDVLATYWTNFAKTGNPNGDGLVQWKPFSSDDRDYLELKFQLEPRQNLYEKRVKFMLQDIPNQIKNKVKTEL